MQRPRQKNTRLNYESGMENAYNIGFAKGKAKAEAIEEVELNAVIKMLKYGFSPEDVSRILEIDLNKLLMFL